MKIFSKEDIERIRRRAKEDTCFIERIEKNTKEVRGKLYIQKSGVATWYHYFTCPHCGTRLTFDYNNSEYYTCPECGEVQSGEPYLGAWWETVLTMTSSAAYELAVGYIATGREDFLSRAKEIILGYAENYKNYEVHGGIPYNHPGRFASQVLSDCEPICYLTKAYSILSDNFTDDEKALIENEMFRPAAEHQKKYMTPQLHNHEVAICASIGAIGIAIGDEELIRFATDTKYGLKYQIDHAYLDDDMWFECSVSYHIYALRWFMMFEKMAKDTDFSLFKNLHYRDKLYNALVFPLKLRVDQTSTLRLNDGHGSLCNNEEIYEYAYSYFGTDDILTLLCACYSNGERETIDALLYGVDHLDCATCAPIESYFSESGSGLAIVRGSDDRMLLLKATPYGGEHDHYDRLALSFRAFGWDACMDFGTASGYGSPLHYGYFKNTATHNTVVIDGKNMAPCDTRVRKYRVNAPDDIYLDAETLPPEEYKMLDSFTIKQWDDEVYRGVSMRRVVSWHNKYFIDVFFVNSDNEYTKEWTWHVDGATRVPESASFIGKLSSDGAQAYFDNAYSMQGEGIIKLSYCGKEANLDIYTLSDEKELIFCEGPNNPASSKISYLLERSKSRIPVFINVIEAYQAESVIDSVDISVLTSELVVKVRERSGKERCLKLDF